METKNVAYLGDGIIISEYLHSAKTLFEKTIAFVEEGGVIFKEKEVLTILMDSVLAKVDNRILQEMVRTKNTGKLNALPEEYLPKDNVRDSIWQDVDFNEFRNKLAKQLNCLKQSQDEDYEKLKELIKDKSKTK